MNKVFLKRFALYQNYGEPSLAFKVNFI